VVRFSRTDSQQMITITYITRYFAFDISTSLVRIVRFKRLGVKAFVEFPRMRSATGELPSDVCHLE